MKISGAIDGYFIDRGLELAETTITNYRHYFSLFHDFIGNKEIEAITSRDITRFLTHLSKARGMSDRSVYDVRARLSPLWTWVASELDLPNIVSSVAKPRYKKSEIIPYTKYQLQQLLQALSMTSNGEHVAAIWHEVSDQQRYVTKQLFSR